MFKKKIQSIPLDKYFQIVNQEYVTVQIIPNKSNRNNNTDAIASIINKMYLKTNEMVKRENKKLIISTQMKASYYIHISKDKVEFYFIIPKIHITKFKTKFIEIWKNVEIKEVDGIPVDLNKGTKYQLNYKYNDSLSLNVDKRSNDLLNANLSTLEVMDTGESIGILYNFIPTNDKQSNYFHVKHKDYIKQYKDGYNMKKSKNATDILVMAIKFLIGFIDDFISSMQKNINSNPQVENKNKIVAIKKEPTQATKNKAIKEICKTQIVLVAQAESKDREKTLLNSLSNSFKSITEDNELIAKELTTNINEFSPVLKGIGINNTSVEENQNFISLAGRELIEEYRNINHLEFKENPVPEELKEGVINLGPVKYKDNQASAYVSNDKSLQSLPLAIMGGSRSGKSTFSINMCKNIIDAGEGLIVIDFIKNTELAEEVKAITPQDRLIEIDLSNPAHIQSLAYNEIEIKEGMSTEEIKKIANRKTNFTLELVNTLNTEDKQLSSKMRKYLGAAGRIAYCYPGTSLKDLLGILQFHKTRHYFINNLSEELKQEREEDILKLLELDEWSKETKDKPSEVCGTKDTKIEGIIDRIDILRENIVIDSMISKKPENNIDFVEAMEQGKVILIRMRDIDFDDEVSVDILTTFFIQKIWIATKIRGTMHKYPRRCTVLIDEIFQSPTSQKILAKTFVQSAKFGLKYVLTLHYMDQLSKEAQAALKNANSSYMLISGVDKKAYQALEEEFSVHGYCLDDLLNLKQYHSLNLMKSKNRYEAFITKLPSELKVTENKIQNIA